MTRDDINRMAREAGFEHIAEADYWHPLFERFAALVAAAEREACARVCEDKADDLSEGDWDSACINCATAIRARGQH